MAKKTQKGSYLLWLPFATELVRTIKEIVLALINHS